MGLSSKAAGGTGLLAIFVDLDPEDVTGFRPFLVEDMFPPRIDIGFGQRQALTALRETVSNF